MGITPVTERAMDENVDIVGFATDKHISAALKEALRLCAAKPGRELIFAVLEQDASLDDPVETYVLGHDDCVRFVTPVEDTAGGHQPA